MFYAVLWIIVILTSFTLLLMFLSSVGNHSVFFIFKLVSNFTKDICFVYHIIIITLSYIEKLTWWHAANGPSASERMPHCICSIRSFFGKLLHCDTGGSTSIMPQLKNKPYQAKIKLIELANWRDYFLQWALKTLRY